MTVKSKNLDKPATKRQLWALFCATKQDWRDRDLTIQDASTMLEQLDGGADPENIQKPYKARKANRVYHSITKDGKTTVLENGYKKFSDKWFEELITKATKAAEKAGDAWVDAHRDPAWVVTDELTGLPVGTMLDVCGFGSIEVRDHRTRFAKWLARKEGRPVSQIHGVYLDHKYRGRQEWSLNEDTARAGLTVLQEAGIKGLRFYSRID